MFLVCSFLIINSKFFLCFELLIVFSKFKKKSKLADFLLCFIPVAFASNMFVFCNVVVNCILFILNVNTYLSYRPHLDFVEVFSAGFLDLFFVAIFI